MLVIAAQLGLVYICDAPYHGVQTCLDGPDGGLRSISHASAYKPEPTRTCEFC
jgi:hypothetical protein